MNIDELIGNEKVKTQLKLNAKASKMRNSSVNHVLMSGPPGCGKTSMANALAALINSKFIPVSPESLKSPKDIYRLIENLDYTGYDIETGEIIENIKPAVVFFDEIHNLPMIAQELLGIAMENWSIAVPDKNTGKSKVYWIPRFTIIGATTLEGKLSKPFLDRFKMIAHFKLYSLQEAVLIVQLHAEKKGWEIHPEAALDIARRSRGIPRIMVRYLDSAIDTAIVRGHTSISPVTTGAVFSILGIDKSGLKESDINLLIALHEAGVPVGVDTLSIMLSESKHTIEKTIEPYLIRQRFLLRSGKGRTLTEKGKQYLIESGYVKEQGRFRIV